MGGVSGQINRGPSSPHHSQSLLKKKQRPKRKAETLPRQRIVAIEPALDVSTFAAAISLPQVLQHRVDG